MVIYKLVENKILIIKRSKRVRLFFIVSTDKMVSGLKKKRQIE